MYNQGLFSSWVPKLVQLLLIIIFMSVIIPVNGVYSGNITYMIGSTGALSEYFIWANYAGIIGMGAAMPLILRMKFRFKIRDKVTVIFLLLAGLSYMNGTTHQPLVIVVNSLLIGFLKMIVMLEFIIPILFMVSPDGNRGRFYSVFYPFSIIASQAAGYFLAVIAYQYNWEHAHLLSAAVCLVLALAAWIFMHNKYFGFKMPLYYIDWISIILFIIVFMAGAYVFAFGKQQDWFHSARIIWASLISFASMVIMVVRQYTLKRPYLSFKIFRRPNVWHGLFMLLMTGMFLATGAVQNIFTVAILQYDVVTSNSLNLMMIPGILASGFYMAYWFKQGRGLKMFIFLGFAAMLGYTVIMYMSMGFQFSYNMWYLPMFLKGFGMGALFIAVWYYTLDNLEMNSMMAATGLVLVWRTFFSVGVFSALFGWLQYRFQVQAIGDAAVYLDGTTLGFSQMMQNMKAIQLNAILAAGKKLLGLVSIAGVGVLLYVLAYDFEIKRYNFYRGLRLSLARHRHRKVLEKAQLQELEDAAGAAF